jgi:hypothetical protein
MAIDGDPGQPPDGCELNPRCCCCCEPATPGRDRIGRGAAATVCPPDAAQEWVVRAFIVSLLLCALLASSPPRSRDTARRRKRTYGCGTVAAAAGHACLVLTELQ